MKVELIKEFTIEAAHRNENARGPAARLHGHSFRIEIIVEGEVDPAIGWLIDYGVIKEAFRPLYEKLDHSYLNEIEGMNDAALEDVAAWIEDRLAPQFVKPRQTVRKDSAPGASPWPSCTHRKYNGS